MNTVFFFDWDGTLADSMNLCVEELRLTLSRMGLPELPESHLRRCNGPTYEESVAILNIPPERAGEYLAARLQAELELCPTVSRPFPGVREMLLRLKKHARLCVVTNGLDEYLQLSLKSFGFEDLFDRTATFRAGRSKTEALAELLSELRPERCAMIGDRVGDLLAGKACGIPTVACHYGFGTPTEWAEGDYQAATVEELESVLLRLLDGEAAR